MSLGKIANSIFSATNENTAALASLNFDFSLVKFEAPKEFVALGKSLSSRRRNDAEEGHIHRTARRLGALFEALIPPIPELRRAYGLRVSEIIKSPDVNLQTFRDYGPFQDFVGVDGTSIWAAMTSSSADSPIHSPLAVHLLACMLERAWSPAEATAIWCELISERQTMLRNFVGDSPFTPSSLWAARQEVTRREVAEWDASARSWLRSADDVKNSEQTRLMLILKNVSLPVCGAKSTYSQVVEAWRQALSGLECLLKGMPQQVSNASVLLALSSWHLYPRLTVFAQHKPVPVIFDDPLLPKEAIITIGLQSLDPAKAEGMRWSLMLSHLRYYGDPVPATYTDDNTRVTMTKLRCVALAGLFATWEIPFKDTLAAARFLRDVWAYFSAGVSTTDISVDSFKVLALAAENVLDLQKEDEGEFNSLVKWGRRRAKHFLGGYPHSLPPMFGLLNPHILHALSEDDPTELPIRYLREVAKAMGLKSSDAIISYPHPNGTRGLLVYTTAVPHERSSSRLSNDGSTKPELAHCRWLVQHRRSESISCSCHPVCMADCRCAIAHNICSTFCHPEEHRRCHYFGFTSQTSMNAISRSGEDCREVDQNELQTTPESNNIYWRRPPSLFHSHGESHGFLKCPSLLGESNCCTCFDMCTHSSSTLHRAVFSIVKGDRFGYALYVNTYFQGHARSQSTRTLHFQNQFQKEANASLSLASAADLTKRLVNHQSLVSYMAQLRSPSYNLQNQVVSSTAMLKFVIDKFKSPLQFWRSTRALALASQIYQSLHGATIPLRIVSTELQKSSWLPASRRKRFRNLKNENDTNSSPSMNSSSDDSDSDSGEGDTVYYPDPEMSLEQAFACIAMFESGVHNIRPLSLKDVMALSSANSLFIAKRLISDPFKKIPQNRVQRIVGNVGRPGITMLVPPRDVRIRPLSNDYKIVNHAPYDGKREDNFRGTTLHLSFTEWQLPIDTDTRSAIDVEVSLLEAVISVYDSGHWVGDLDVMAVDYDMLLKTKHSSACFAALETRDNSPRRSSYAGISIDTWEELLDPPEGTSIFRGHKNWPARLAAVCIISQRNLYKEVIFVDPDVAPCNHCLAVEDGSFVLID